MVQIWEESRRTYGARRVRAELGDAHDQNVNLKLVRSIMREQDIAGLPARRRYKRSDSNRYTSEDLVNRSVRRDGPNQLWMTDITEHPTTWVLAVVATLNRSDADVGSQIQCRDEANVLRSS